MPKRVLIVDDDGFFRAAIGDGLQAAGYEVAVASDGLEALEKVGQTPHDFIILDLIMPRLDGIRTCKMLKRHPRHKDIPVIILTGLGREGLKALEDLGAEAMVAKRQAGTTLTQILKTLELLESASLKSPPPAEAAQDLAERRIVNELFAERRHIQALLAALGDGLVELDAEGRLLYVNPAGLDMVGRSEDELIGSSASHLFGPAHVAPLQEALRELQARAEGDALHLEVSHACKTIGVTLTAVGRPDGARSALLVLRDLTDLTRRTRSLQALAAVGQDILTKLDLPTLLREIVARTAALLGAERCALFQQVDAVGEQVRLRCIQAFGLSPHYAEDLYLAPGEGVVGKAVADRRPVSTADILQDPVLQLSAASRTSLQQEGVAAILAAPILLPEEVFGTLTVYRPGGHRFTPQEVELVSSLARFAAVAIENARLYAEVQNHSQGLERRVAERTRELQALNRELELASRHKSLFLANMSHELRTPLHAVLGYTDLLLGAGGAMPTTLTAKQEKYLRAVRGGGERLLELINDMLDLAKIEAGRMTLAPKEVSVRAALQDAINPAQLQALQKNLSLDVCITEVPPTFTADPPKVQQVLGNLLANAIKFTPPGGRITVEARGVPDPRGGALEVSVRDTGIGIAPEDQERLFQEFVQLDNSLAKSHQGTGLGLALTKRLVALHGGRIWAASPGAGRGATFTFRLPCRPEPLTGKILVVDDDTDVRTAIGQALAAPGLEVEGAAGGLEALGMIERAVPDALVLDLHMPLMHGHRVIRNLRRRPATAKLPILVVTGLGREDGHAAVEQGADAYLTKPFRIPALLEAVDSLLERRGAHALVEP